MSTTVTLEEAQARLPELIRALGASGEIKIVDQGQQIARIVAETSAPASRPQPGLGRGSIRYLAPDFDEIPEEFKDDVT